MTNRDDLKRIVSHGGRELRETLLKAFPSYEALDLLLGGRLHSLRYSVNNTGSLKSRAHSVVTNVLAFGMEDELLAALEEQLIPTLEDSLQKATESFEKQNSTSGGKEGSTSVSREECVKWLDRVFNFFLSAGISEESIVKGREVRDELKKLVESQKPEAELQESEEEDLLDYEQWTSWLNGEYAQVQEAWSRMSLERGKAQIDRILDTGCLDARHVDFDVLLNELKLAPRLRQYAIERMEVRSS